MPPLPASAERVQTALRQQGYDCQIQLLASSARTAPEAAASVGCKLGQIVKSLIFQVVHSEQAILALVSGSNQLSEHKLSQLIGQSIRRPDANFVRSRTGFAIGGVAPIGHREPLSCYIDADLMQYDIVWAAAGTPNTLFDTTPAALIEMTNGLLANIKA